MILPPVTLDLENALNWYTYLKSSQMKQLN